MPMEMWCSNPSLRRDLLPQLRWEFQWNSSQLTVLLGAHQLQRAASSKACPSQEDSQLMKTGGEILKDQPFAPKVEQFCWVISAPELLVAAAIKLVSQLKLLPPPDPTFSPPSHQCDLEGTPWTLNSVSDTASCRFQTVTLVFILIYW